MLKPPRLIVFGGANGSGKSTLTHFYKRKLETSSVILDPDAVAMDLNPADPGKAAIQAARYVLGQQQNFLKSGQSFVLETTLSSHGNLELLSDAKARGWVVRLLYVGLADPNLNVQRVASRVRDGGHGVLEADIRRRFERSMMNLARAAELVDLLRICLEIKSVNAGRSKQRPYEKTLSCRGEPCVHPSETNRELIKSQFLSVHDNSGRFMKRVALIKQHHVLRLVRQNGSSWWESALLPYLRQHEF
jgi:predicted ABC-type ATPase